VDGEERCGLASTLRRVHKHDGEPAVPEAGQLVGRTGFELVAALDGFDAPRRSLGLAALNALLPRHPSTWVERNAEQVIATLGAGKRVTLIGHFPFVPRLRATLDELFVIDRHPLAGDYPADAAPDILPQADLVAITSMTILNNTFESLLALCRPEATVLLLGPSTPLSPMLFTYGVDLLAGSIVEDVGAVMQVVKQGGNFRQVHRAGVRLVTITRPGLA
jgi:uncharacterized protein (DUF4213/DUF364 family)